MSLIKIVDLNHELGRPDLEQIFGFWFEEYVIFLYNEFKPERKTYSEKVKYSENNVQNFKNNVKGIIWF